MRSRSFIWFSVSVLCFLSAMYCWRLGDQWAANRAAASAGAAGATAKAHAAVSGARTPFVLLTQPGSLNALPVPAPTNAASRKNYRLSNSTKTASELARSDRAIVLENALIDTSRPLALSIPEHLRAHGDPGSYIVQASHGLDARFRALVEAAGATVVAYIPNNAYLVRGSAAAASSLSAQSDQVQTVLPFEPEYKLKGALLQFGVEQTPLPAQTTLNLLLFPGALATTLPQLQQLGAQVIEQGNSYFGPVIKVRPPSDSLATLAGLTGVQELEVVHTRAPANDLSRPLSGVASDSVIATNYLGLTGKGVLVNVNDSGVDATHPDLTGRVTSDAALSATDTNGHGTHVAGIIAGDGTESMTVSNAQGSIMPATTNQFRGVAPKAKLFSMLADPIFGPGYADNGSFGPSYSDSYFQETAARTNAFISNNSWNYADLADRSQVATYDLAAASYDAAVRDALPLVSGSQPVLFVFSAGDGGAGQTDGTGGNADSIQSPATAKNVITVGAYESVRQITNQVHIDSTNGSPIWTEQSDDTNQVAAFSSRGNVGIGVEGDFGRFKPDLIAPGTFIVSTRSTDWDEQSYYGYHLRQHPTDVLLGSGQAFVGTFTLPDNTSVINLALEHRRLVGPYTLGEGANSPPSPNLPIFVSPVVGGSPGYTYSGTNLLRIANPPPATNGYYYEVSNPSTQAVLLDIAVDITYQVTNDDTFGVLSNMNEADLGQYYRYESGTSMSAADVSGALALMLEFLQSPTHLPSPRTNSTGGAFGHSPALMKAMLINGARSVGTYNFQVQNSINFQGWGRISLPTSLHPGLANEGAPTNSMFLFDQDPTNSLATNDRHNYQVSIAPEAQSLPLRITLVWSDPPGNPLAGKKLVNDLDLIATNLDSVGSSFELDYFGNDIQGVNEFNLPWDTNTVPNIDSVNNVENIFIPPPLGSNYTITVVGHRVNVNAVAENPNNIVQDYALVISCGDGDAITNAMTVKRLASSSANTPLITALTNSFVGAANYYGQTIQNQRVGANSPLLGTNSFILPSDANAMITIGVTNQWSFYVIQNDSSFTNARFLIANPRELSVPRMGVDALFLTNANRLEADVDMYVSTDPSLLALNPLVVSNAYKLIGRAGSGAIVLTNATQGAYYIGVKSEDQMGAEFTLQVLFSLFPFSINDAFGGHLAGYGAAIPDGDPQSPGVTNVLLGPNLDPGMLVRRVIVTNYLAHELMGDLEGLLSYPDGTYCVLNNHSPARAITNEFVYDDSDQGDIFDIYGNPARHSDGPGSLSSFAGRHLNDVFTFYEEDNALQHVGYFWPVGIFLERQPPLIGGATNTIAANHCSDDYIEIGPQVTAVTFSATLLSGAGPISMQIRKLGGGSTDTITNGPGVSITLNEYSTPQLSPGTYDVHVCNVGLAPVKVYVIAFLTYGLNQVQTSSYATNPLTAIPDNAVSYTTLNITNHMTIASMDVGLLITNMSRISDLAITLISPSGQRIILFEDRGGASVNGLGSFNAQGGGTAGFATYTLTPFYTNNFDDAAVGPYAPGATFDRWSVLTNEVTVYPTLPAPWLSNNVLVVGQGILSNALPVTNALTLPLALANQQTIYQMTFRATHAPYLAGMISWWPFDADGADIFGGLSGQLYGDVSWTGSTGMVNQAFFGDGVATRMVVPRCPALDVGPRPYGFSVQGWIRPDDVSKRAPLVEWYDPTNPAPVGMQFWLGDLSSANPAPGGLSAAFYGTNGLAHFIALTNNVLTNGGWQHVALTYEPASHQAILYTNGRAAVTQVLTLTNSFPRAVGDLYFGFDPPAPPLLNLPGIAYRGGLDEFSLFERPLTACEVLAIYQAGTNGMYGTNVLWCPLTNTLGGASLSVQLLGALGASTFSFTNGFDAANGLHWTNGPAWETNTFWFTNAVMLAATNGPITNVTPMILSRCDPNLIVDDFVLSAVITNFYSGAMDFTENTNLALLPIKFAPTPYVVSNLPPRVVFANNFANAAPGVYAAGSAIAGMTNALGATFYWTNLGGPVSVISNALVDVNETKCVALANNGIQASLPTTPGQLYQLTYSVRGPGAVSWWPGDVNPVDHRAWDLLGGNDAAFVQGATTAQDAEVGANSLLLPGIVDPATQLVSKLEIGDPANLRMTNAFTMECWLKPLARSSFVAETPEQILFRGDGRFCMYPYYFALERVTADTLDILLHIDDGLRGDCGIVLETANQPVLANNTWQHVAVVFESNVAWTNNAPWPTNEMRIYYNGVQLTPANQAVYLEDPTATNGRLFTEFTSRFPFRDLDPAFSPGVSIGARSRNDYSEPYRGEINDLTVYGRALTAQEILSIYKGGPQGKADRTVAPASSLAKLSVSIDGSQRDVVYGENDQWATHTIQFAAASTNVLLTLQSLLPGTIVGGISLSEIPTELNYLPEESLQSLFGQDAYGTWTLEIVDTRAGPAPGADTTNALPQLTTWQLNFQSYPTTLQPIIELAHGIAYTNSLPVHGYQNFVVPVPQWATNATNVLLYSANFAGSPLAAGVLCDTNTFPTSITNALFWPPVLAGATNLLSSNTAWLPGYHGPPLYPGQSYFLTVTNTNTVPITFALGVSFDIVTLTNCEPLTHAMVGPAGIPRYFQFDVPPNSAALSASQSVAFYLSGVESNYTGFRSNVTVVLSEHLPLPDLTHYDYISYSPRTNDDVLMTVNHTTPFAVETNRWYVGVFNAAATNVPFSVQVCSSSNYPTIIALTNDLPFAVSSTINTNFLAPPGPPEWFFYRFTIVDFVDAVLFELYGLNGAADLVLQRDTPPTMAPYFAGSFQPGAQPEQIVVRASSVLPDLRGDWYLGVYSREPTNQVAYTIRAALLEGGMLTSALPLVITSQVVQTNWLLLSWNSVEGNWYTITFTNASSSVAWTNIVATTPLSTALVPVPPTNGGYVIKPVPTPVSLRPPLSIARAAGNLLRLSWPQNFTGFTLQSTTSLRPPVWVNVGLPVTGQGADWVVYAPAPYATTYFRLVQ